jgi:hypothetical protein
MAKKLVRAVDQVDDHWFIPTRVVSDLIYTSSRTVFDAAPFTVNRRDCDWHQEPRFDRIRRIGRIGQIAPRGAKERTHGP